MKRYLVCSHTPTRLTPGHEWYENHNYACRHYLSETSAYAYTMARNQADLLDKREVDGLIDQSSPYWLQKMTITEG